MNNETLEKDCLIR